MKRILLTVVLALFIAAFGKTQTTPITISPNQSVASYRMTYSEYNSWINNDEFNSGKCNLLIKNIYQIFNDEFDFIFLVLNEWFKPDNLHYAGIYKGISNAVTGIGSIIFDNCDLYGSSGKLKAVIALTTKQSINTGLGLHELGHHWANHIISTRDWDSGKSAEFVAGPHWGFTGGSTKSVLGGFQQSTLQTNIGGNSDRYKVGSFQGNFNSDVPFTDLELYLMGMIPLTDVADFDVFRGLSQVTSTTDWKGREFTASTRETYDNAKILEAAGGERNPSYVTAQKDFRLLIVILTWIPLSSKDWSYFDSESELFGRTSDVGFYNFWKATRGLGTIETGNLLDAVKDSVDLKDIVFTDPDSPQIEEITGLEDIQIEGIAVFPNPLTGILNIDFKSEDYTKVKIYNSQGILLATERATFPLQQFDFSDYKNGLYIIEVIKSSGEVRRIKIIKE